MIEFLLIFLQIIEEESQHQILEYTPPSLVFQEEVNPLMAEDGLPDTLEYPPPTQTPTRRRRKKRRISRGSKEEEGLKNLMVEDVVQDRDLEEYRAEEIKKDAKNSTNSKSSLLQQ